MQQTDRSCMTKGVRPLPTAGRDPGHLQTSADDTVQDGPAFICLMGAWVANTSRRLLSVWPFQIAQYCFAGFAQPGQFGNRARLRVSHSRGSHCQSMSSRRNATISRLAGRKWPTASKRRNPVVQSASSLDESSRQSEPPRDAVPKEFAHRHRSVVRSRYCSDRGRFARCRANSARSFEGTPCSPRSFPDAYPCNAAAGAHRHPERASAQGSLAHHAAQAQSGTPTLVLYASTASQMPTRATPASTRRILVPDRSEMPRWPSRGGCNGPMSVHQPQEHVHGSFG